MSQCGPATMALRVYNSLTNRVEAFEPLEPGKVRMYNCGPTVYGYQHIGNYRSYLFADTVRRYLEFKGFEVTQVVNLTDVGHLTEDDMREAGEDKIMKKAKELGWDPYKVAEHFSDAFFEDRRILGFLEAHHFPRATAHVKEMIEIIETLLEKGFAYKVGGNIYFDVAKFTDYGKLSGNTLDKIKSGARVEVNPEKKHPADFALWKTDEKHLMQFDSPWGRGFPGWHIECSAMARKYLGDTLDIHTGGEDNIFPHHESEIAQSEAAIGKPFVRYWIHPRFLLFEGEKMAKRLGSDLTIPNLVKKGIDPMAIRYALVSTHYRQQMQFAPEILDNAKKALDRLREFKRRLMELEKAGRGEPANKVDVAPMLEKARADFMSVMDDDLNVAGAMAVLHDMARDLHRAMDQESLGSRSARAVLDTLDGFDSVFGVLGGVSIDEEAPAELQAFLEKREAARKAKDWKTADAMRDEIQSKGWVVVDSKDGPKLKKK